MNEILQGVLRWSWPSPDHGYSFNGYLVRLPHISVCIDPVQADEETLREIIEERPKMVLISNRNHGRFTNTIVEKTRATPVIHPSDLSHARSQGILVEQTFDPSGDGRIEERLLPLIVVPVPGKSRGEVAFHWPERRLLFVGDALIGHPAGKLGLLKPQVVDDMDLLKASVKALLHLDFDAVLVADGEPILKNGKAALEALCAQF